LGVDGLKRLQWLSFLVGAGGLMDDGFNTKMENVWHIVKTAEHKAINIQKKRDPPFEIMGCL